MGTQILGMLRAAINVSVARDCHCDYSTRDLNSKPTTELDDQQEMRGLNDYKFCGTGPDALGKL